MLASCVTKNGSDALTFEEFNKAELNSNIVIEAYVQDFESWWDNKQTVYLADIHNFHQALPAAPPYEMIPYINNQLFFSQDKNY